MDIEDKGGYTLRGLEKINFLLGKNGCGKSKLLKSVEQATKQGDEFGNVRYITPERGGDLLPDAAVEQQMTNQETWIDDSRRVNQFHQFRQQSVAQYRKLKLLVLEELESVFRQQEEDPNFRDDTKKTFDKYVSEINSLLDNIEIKRDQSTFQIYQKGTENIVGPKLISSGEAELISLGIELLVFEKECVEAKSNILYLDSPDVHLHPDLQVRLVRFLKKLVERTSFKIIVATHSTALLGSLLGYEHQAVNFMVRNQTTLNFRPISSVYRKVLPIFGAHPLSNLFNEAPVLLVDGEDDQRIWQQAVRTANGELRIYPCPVDGEGEMRTFETEICQIINSVYDDAKAYSIRDRDGGEEDIADMPPITRMRLSCRAAENLLLSDDVLVSLGTDWASLSTGIATWLDSES